MDGNPWSVDFMAMLHMANDSSLFRVREELEGNGWRLVGNVFVRGEERSLPLYEAKMVHHFDHRFGTYEGQTEAQANQGKLPELDDAQHAAPDLMPLPRYWVAAGDIDGRLPKTWAHKWLAGWRRIARSSDERTLIASVLPEAAIGDSEFLVFPKRGATWCFAAILSSFVCDYATRQKLGGTNASFYIFEQIAVATPDQLEALAPQIGATWAAFLLPRVLELTYTARDLQPFAHDCGWDGPPFRWDADRRFLLRCELDAAFFHLYGLPRDDVDYVLGTFPVVCKNETREFGEHRTRRVVLEVFDAMVEAARTGVAYVTRLVPGPADAAVAHPPRDGVAA